MGTRKIRKNRQKKGQSTNRQTKPHFTTGEKQHALQMMVDGITVEKAAAAVGASEQTLYTWKRRAKENGTWPLPTAQQGGEENAGDQSKKKTIKQSSEQTEATDSTTRQKSPYTPKDPGTGLSQVECDEILGLKKDHPSYGPAQIRAQLKRFKGWRIANKAIARVLKANGYELVHLGSRPQGDKPIRFEAPRPNALWQLDFTSLRVGGEKIHLLVIEDDFSRFAVGHAVSFSPSSQVVTITFKQAMARHGKPEAVRTDRGGAFISKSEPESFARYLEVELVDHIVGRSYHPQGGGKVESLIGTVQRELWETEHFHTREEAERRLNDFFNDYNHRRAHMGIDGLTPADKYFGRADKVLEVINALSRQRQGALSQAMRTPGVFEEIIATQHGAPLEVLRLMVSNGQLEIRFCGHRVQLGKIK